LPSLRWIASRPTLTCENENEPLFSIETGEYLD
jgi:hypothetical protein